MPRDTHRLHFLCPVPSLGKDTLYHHYQELEARGDNLPREPVKNGQTGACGGVGNGCQKQGCERSGRLKGLLPKGGELQVACGGPTPSAVLCCPHVEDRLTFPSEDTSLLGEEPPRGKISGLGL